MISLSSSKVTRAMIFSLLFVGLSSTCVTTQAMDVRKVTTQAVPQSVKNAAIVVAFVIPAISAYLALTQDEQPVLKKGTLFEQIVNWYRRVICGKASKKTQMLQPNGELKDVYSKSSGVFGKAISLYDANEKDVKKAAAIGALFAIATLNTDLKDILGNLMKGAPYAEMFKKA